MITAALAAGQLSQSWSRHICEWTDRLPETQRADADEILAGAARGGAGLADLAGLAREMYERCAPPDRDDGFEDRWFRLGITVRGAGRAEGDLTPGCAAALAAVLEALGKKAGPEDTRTGAQRRHDALEEACRRLIRAGMVPARAGQPTRVLVHLTLAQLRGLPGASAAESAWAAARATQPGWLAGPEADAALCDATIVPIVTGHVDWAALDHLADMFLLAHGTSYHAGTSQPGARACTGQPLGPGDRLSGGPGEPAASGGRAWPGQPLGPGDRLSGGPGEPAGDRHRSASGRGGASGQLPPPRSAPGTAAPVGTASGPPGCGCAGDGPGPVGPGLYRPAGAALSPDTRDRLRRALLGLATDALSGPGGLAARLRAALDGGPLTSTSLPLDVGAATEIIPAHLRRAVTARHSRCAFPGCDQPATVCDIHHIVPRARGGATSLPNLVPLCAFHHLTAIHRWGWVLALHSDGTTTATSPDGKRTLDSRGPPRRAA